MKVIAVIHNPRSKKNMKRPHIADKVKDILGKYGTIFVPSSLDELLEVAKEIKRNGYEVIGINGGDGTNHQIITRLITVYKGERLPLIAHLRGGTMNTVSNALYGIKGSVAGITRKLVDHYKENKPFKTRTTKVLKINDKYGFMFGIGFVANLMDIYYEDGKTGPIKALQIIYKAIASAILSTDYIERLFKPVVAKVIIDGKKLDFKEYSVLVSSAIRNIGLNFRAIYRAEELPDKIHVLAGKATAFEVIARLRKLYVGHEPDFKHIIDTLAKHIEILADTPLKYTIDGDMYEDTNIVLTPGPLLSYIQW
ncbi:MAG: diacylglycerol/lipid kinase family protein [bacterium]